jgi:RsiW-degrading membrane proteinase PrsW (M82 family)
MNVNLASILAYVIATLIPILALVVIRALDLYKTGNFRYVVLSFLWGFVAFGIASYVNPWFYNQGYITNINDISRFIAPNVEEILKSLILIYLITRIDFTYFIDGAIYGFAAGIGFAIIENYQYIANAYDPGLGTAIGRVISTNLIHAAASGMVGIAFGLARFERGGRRVMTILVGLIAAILTHMIFNITATSANPFVQNNLLIIAAALGLGGAGLIAFAIQRGLVEERAWIEEKLGMADRVTRGEAAIVNRFSELDDLLAPLAERFGEDKAEKIQDLLTLQARLGILRKTLDKLTDETMRQAVSRQMEELRSKMDQGRREVGSYAMLYLRHTIPAGASPLWTRLETLIQERAAAQPTTTGPSLWDRLNQRTATPSNHIQSPSGSNPSVDQAEQNRNRPPKQSSAAFPMIRPKDPPGEQSPK